MATKIPNSKKYAFFSLKFIQIIFAIIKNRLPKLQKKEKTVT